MSRPRPTTRKEFCIIVIIRSFRREKCNNFALSICKDTQINSYGTQLSITFCLKPKMCSIHFTST